MTAQRWTLVEFGPSRAIVSAIAEASGLDQMSVRSLLYATGERIASVCGMSSSPLSIEADLVRATNIAGLIRVAPGIEIEIAPKFLGDDEIHTRWREDFFFLANLSKHGKILPSERLHAGRAAARDLPALVARSVVEMHRDNSRRPLRTYRHFEEFDFSADGDLNPETITLPSADGFEQTTIRYGRKNVYNSTISAAAQLLHGEVSDTDLRRQLGRVITDLGPQTLVRSPRRRILPSRSRRWQNLYDLSVDVLDGLGLVFDPRRPAHSPGYVVGTWQIWEDFLTLACRLAFENFKVKPQHSFVLGTRTKRDDIHAARDMTVTPDITVIGAESRDRPMLLDAKYKTREGQRQQRIDEADIYESLAFAKASDAQTVALLYPATPTDVATPIGSVTPFDKVRIGELVIHGLQIEMRGISGTGMMRRFVSELAQNILRVVSPDKDKVIPGL